MKRFTNSVFYLVYIKAICVRAYMRTEEGVVVVRKQLATFCVLTLWMAPNTLKPWCTNRE